MLAIGNVLNGGTAKGQADGFDLPVFTKLTSMRDVNGKSLLEYIMLKMKEADEELPAKISALISKTVFKDVDVDYIKGKARELQAMVSNAKASLDQVKSLSATDRFVQQSIDKDEFIIQMTDFVDKAEKELATIVEDSQKVVSTHIMLCDFYGVDAKDEMREKSETFFKVF